MLAGNRANGTLANVECAMWNFETIKSSLLVPKAGGCKVSDICGAARGQEGQRSEIASERKNILY